jgi:hypothetical protein
MQSLLDIWRILTRDPVGLLLTLLGVVLGSASLVFLASGLEGASVALASTSQQATGSDIVRILPERPVGPRAERAPLLNPRDAEALRVKEHLPKSKVGTGSVLHHREASAGSKTMPVGIQSGSESSLLIAGLRVAQGRMLTPQDAGMRRCILGHDVHLRLFEGRWPMVDPSVLIDGSTKLQVVGVLERRPPMGGGSGGETWRVDRKIFVMEWTLERAIQGGPHGTAIHLEMGGEEHVKTTSLRMKPYLEALHRGGSNFTFDGLSQGMDLGEVIEAALMAVLMVGGLVSILVGGINVMNSQLVTVGERAQEFAIRRALGLSRARLMRGVWMESLSITTFGAVIGVVLGLGVSGGLSLILTRLVAPWPFEVVGWSVAASVGTCAVAGLVAGWVPARRASEVAPAVILRGE